MKVQMQVIEVVEDHQLEGKEVGEDLRHGSGFECHV
jgi:hypothetical protein